MLSERENGTTPPPGPVNVPDQRSRERRRVGAVDTQQARRGLSTQYRCRKGVGPGHKAKIYICIDVGVHVDVRLAGMRPIVISRARTTSAPAETEV